MARSGAPPLPGADKAPGQGFECLELCEAQGADLSRSWALFVVGLNAWRRGELGRTAKVIHQALRLKSLVDDLAGEAHHRDPGLDRLRYGRHETGGAVVRRGPQHLAEGGFFSPRCRSSHRRHRSHRRRTALTHGRPRNGFPSRRAPQNHPIKTFLMEVKIFSLVLKLGR